MENSRKIRKIIKGKSVLEGAGIRLKRLIGFNRGSEFDPFLLLDDFRADDPRDYSKGFPWHPHRGIETITYEVEGSNTFDLERNPFAADGDLGTFIKNKNI